MTFTEMIARMAKNADMSYDEVLRMLPDTMQTQAARSNAYRSFTARLYVTDEYQPYLDFYCATSEGGHFFNIIINILGAFVHSSRLQYIEFFGKFYEAGGRAFVPLALRTKYTDIVK